MSWEIGGGKMRPLVFILHVEQFTNILSLVILIVMLISVVNYIKINRKQKEKLVELQKIIDEKKNQTVG